MHHMTGQREFFSDLDSGVKGSIKFNDASVVEIKGVSSIIFKAKMGKHRLLTARVLHPGLEELHHQHRAAGRAHGWRSRTECCVSRIEAAAFLPR